MERCICCLCGRERREKNLTCPRCYELYRKEAPDLILQGEVLELNDWVERKAKVRLAEFQPLEAELAKKKDELDALQNRIREESFRQLKSQVGDKRIPKDVFSQALEGLRKKLWKEANGDKLYAETMNLRKEVEEKTSALQQTLETIAKTRRSRTATTEAETIIKNAQEGK